MNILYVAIAYELRDRLALLAWSNPFGLGLEHLCSVLA